jgi:hypothetical protein
MQGLRGLRRKTPAGGFAQLLSRKLSTLEPWETALGKEDGVEVRRIEGRGRGLYALSDIKAGTVVMDEAALVSVASPASSAAGPASDVCQHCYKQILPTFPKAVCSCGYAYCSEVCRSAAVKVGHDVVCGPGLRTLDAFCTEHSLNFPRAAAATLAHSLSASADFAAYFERVNRLVTLNLPSDTDAFPAVWRTGFGLVKGAVSPAMSGNVDGFFEHIFNLRMYGRLMGALRLNSFSVQCPIDRAPVAASAPSVARVLPQLDPSLAAANKAIAEAAAAASSKSSSRSSTSSSSSSGVASGGAGANAASSSSDSGCCSGDEACDTSGNAGSCSTNGAVLLAGDVGANAGTAMYSKLSLLNHSCDPNLDVVMGPAAAMAVVARRSIRRGEELRIAYLDCSAPVVERRKKLLHGYGFSCDCDMCKQQLKAAGLKL